MRGPICPACDKIRHETHVTVIDGAPAYSCTGETVREVMRRWGLALPPSVFEQDQN